MRAKLVRQCSYPLTGRGCVDVVVTVLAVLVRREGVLWLEDVAAGFSVDEVLALTDMEVRVAVNWAAHRWPAWSSGATRLTGVPDPWALARPGLG